jgi:hypothetical protein
MRRWWITNDDGDYGTILANTEHDAEVILFHRILKDELPIDCTLIEQFIEPWQAQVIEELSDDDIISIEKA